MSTQVILLERVEKLGKMGDVVAVKPGYARNFLIPQKKALRASKENIAYFETQKSQLEAENAKRRDEAQKLAKKLDGVKVALIRAASEGGQLYGSVASRDIAEAIAEQSGLSIARNMVDLNQNFKNLGLFEVAVTLHPEVKQIVTVNIARSEEEAKIQAETGKALVAGAVDVNEDDNTDDNLADALEDEALAAEKARAEEEATATAEAEAKAAEKAAAKAEKAAAKAAKEEGEEGEEAAAEEATEA